MDDIRTEGWWIWDRWIWRKPKYYKGVGILGALGKIGFSIVWFKHSN